MLRSWVFIILMLVLLSVSGFLFSYFYFSRKLDTTSNSSLGNKPTTANVTTPLHLYTQSPEPTLALALPDELTKDFDPTTNTPVFSVISGDITQKTLVLKMIFPPAYIQEEITSIISCEEEDLTVEKGGVVVATGAEAFFKEFGNLPQETLSMRGLCSDSSCIEISQQCVITKF